MENSRKLMRQGTSSFNPKGLFQRSGTRHMGNLHLHVPNFHEMREAATNRLERMTGHDIDGGKRQDISNRSRVTIPHGR